MYSLFLFKAFFFFLILIPTDELCNFLMFWLVWEFVKRKLLVFVKNELRSSMSCGAFIFR